MTTSDQAQCIAVGYGLPASARPYHVEESDDFWLVYSWQACSNGHHTGALFSVDRLSGSVDRRGEYYLSTLDCSYSEPPTCASDAAEPNNSIADASPLPRWTYHTISAGDPDFWTVQSSAGDLRFALGSSAGVMVEVMLGGEVRSGVDMSSDTFVVSAAELLAGSANGTVVFRTNSPCASYGFGAL